MRYARHLPLQRDVGIFIVLVILSAGIMAVDRVGGEYTVVGELARVVVPFEHLTSRIMTLTFAGEESRLLRSKLIDVSRENALLREQVHEAERLRSMLDFRLGHPDTLRSARVISRLGERMGGGIAIDKGRRGGLAKNMTVICPAGLVGRIIRVGNGASQVKRIVDPGYKVSAIVQRSRATGILSSRSDGRLIMEWVAPDADVAPGDTVISSGLGSITPKGIPIGEVRSLREKTDRFALSVVVEPFVAFDRLEEVFVILQLPSDFGALLEGTGN
jgi:rod shape-determining protein MreC